MEKIFFFSLCEEKTTEPEISPLAKTSSRLRIANNNQIHISAGTLQTSFVKSHQRKKWEDIVITTAAILWCQPGQFYSKNCLSCGDIVYCRQQILGLAPRSCLDKCVFFHTLAGGYCLVSIFGNSKNILSAVQHNLKVTQQKYPLF